MPQETIGSSQAVPHVVEGSLHTQLAPEVPSTHDPTPLHTSPEPTGHADVHAAPTCVDAQTSQAALDHQPFVSSELHWQYGGETLTQVPCPLHGLAAPPGQAYL
eukprot:gene14036-biopygen3821